MRPTEPGTSPQNLFPRRTRSLDAVSALYDSKRVNRDTGCVSAAALAELIRIHQPCVVLTGAGVSTESGIPDFRSATGIWAKYDPYEVASIDAFRRDPERVWDFYALRLGVLADAAPNAAHHALAELESRGLVQAVITQNVDGLHAEAGSRDVIEVHGSIGSAFCLSCGRDEEDVSELLPLPRCLDCGAILKPGVVMFGELLPVAAMERATALARDAGLLLVVGTSLEVWPVAGLPEETLGRGGRLAIVNREPTPYDARAELVLHASAGEVLGAVADRKG
jgi:NAD-dependent deacetylase